MIHTDEQLITMFQRLHLVALPFVSKKIFDIFNKYNQDCERLEELKNIVSNERDYFDLIDLVNQISDPYQSQIRQLFLNCRISNSSKYYYKLLVDIDNTTIENKSIAPISYQNHQIIPGLLGILRYFSGNGISTINFLSARPKIIENQSIHTINRKLSQDLRFSFLTGTLRPIINYTIGKIYKNLDKIEKSYYQMASEKFNNYLSLRELYPHCQFIFIGDDTQGDPYLAYQIVESDSLAWTAIRRVINKKLPMEIINHPRIYFHQSYFQLADILVRNNRASNLLIKDVLIDYNKHYKSVKYQYQQVEFDLSFIKQWGYH